MKQSNISKILTLLLLVSVFTVALSANAKAVSNIDLNIEDPIEIRDSDYENGTEITLPFAFKLDNDDDTFNCSVLVDEEENWTSIGEYSVSEDQVGGYYYGRFNVSSLGVHTVTLRCTDGPLTFISDENQDYQTFTFKYLFEYSAQDMVWAFWDGVVKTLITISFFTVFLTMMIIATMGKKTWDWLKKK